MRGIIADRGVGESRWRRGAQLFEDGYFERISRDVFLCQMASRKDAHRVNLEAHNCDCEDFDFHRHLEPFSCYHIIGTRMYANWLRKSARALAYVFGSAS